VDGASAAVEHDERGPVAKFLVIDVQAVGLDVAARPVRCMRHAHLSPFVLSAAVQGPGSHPTPGRCRVNTAGGNVVMHCLVFPGGPDPARRLGLARFIAANAFVRHAAMCLIA
jgi:hypothetical protein